MPFGPSFFIGGLVCIDFCNTVDHRRQPPAYELLPDCAAAVEWGKAAGILSAKTRIPSGKSRSSLDSLRQTRALLLRVVSPFDRSDRPAQADLAAFNARLAKVSAKAEIIPAGDRFTLACKSPDPLERIAFAALRSAADYLISPDRPPLRSCPGCGWLFLDTSRNRMRRWCVMKICGNRAKAHRHYERARRQKGGAAAG
jgi:predicted RNA-binding Zn ribbon-like protein